MDLSKLSDAELQLLAKGDMRMLSADTLKMLAGDGQEVPAQPQAPATNQRMDAVEPPNWIERQLAKMPDILSSKAESNLRGVVMGAADPSVGAAQLAANLVGAGDKINAAVKAKEDAYEQGRSVSGREGFDAARLAGGLISPANLLIASKVPVATTTLGRIGTGAGAGLVAGLAQPVTNGGNNYATDKTMQAGIGTVTGGVLNPILGKVGDKVASRLSRPDAAGAATKAQQQIDEALQQAGIPKEAVTPDMMVILRQDAANALKTGKKLDVPAALRANDFEALGIKPTLGQITRDPTQFAMERNLRGVAGAGEPLMHRLEQQNQQLSSAIGQVRGAPSEPYAAGRKLVDVLKSQDDSMRGKVTALYQAARNSAGKDADVPMAGLADEYGKVLDEFADKVPGGVRNQFRKFGLEGEKQTKAFTIEEADKLIKSINDHVGADRATNTALGRLREAVKRTVTESSGLDDVFAPARKAAADRFRMQDAIPALRAAANGEVAPDDFVRNYVINGKVEEVNRLAQFLKQGSPEAFEEARAQIGDKITRAAFGENLSGDKLAAPERLAKVIREIGTDKLKAFYSPAEIEQINRIARVASFINSVPSGAPVNSSNTASAALSMLSRIPGVPGSLGLLNSVKNAATNVGNVNRAVNPTIPVGPAPISPDTAALLNRITTGGGVVGSGLLAGIPGQ
ncbi:MAG: hypothetical protein KUL88_01285 [Rhizobium sp.]|nr:hypothetical protein [Rhizobium sp.]